MCFVCLKFKEKIIRCSLRLDMLEDCILSDVVNENLLHTAPEINSTNEYNVVKSKSIFLQNPACLAQICFHNTINNHVLYIFLRIYTVLIPYSEKKT